MAEARPDLIRPLDDVMLDYVERALILSLGNLTLASERLGISAVTLRRYKQRIKQRDEPQVRAVGAGQ